MPLEGYPEKRSHTGFFFGLVVLLVVLNVRLLSWQLEKDTNITAARTVIPAVGPTLELS